MADDGKRTEQVCVKMTERLFLDLGREAAREDRSVAEFVYHVLRREMYGRIVPHKDAGPDNH